MTDTQQAAPTTPAPSPGGANLHLTGTVDRGTRGAPPIVMIRNTGEKDGTQPVVWKRWGNENDEAFPGARRYTSVDLALPRHDYGDAAWTYGALIRVTQAATARALSAHFAAMARLLDERVPADPPEVSETEALHDQLHARGSG